MADPVASATGVVRGASSGLVDAVLRHAFVPNADPVAMVAWPMRRRRKVFFSHGWSSGDPAGASDSALLTPD